MNLIEQKIKQIMRGSGTREKELIKLVSKLLEDPEKELGKIKSEVIKRKEEDILKIEARKNEWAEELAELKK